jgi:hypothetical protein
VEDANEEEMDDLFNIARVPYLRKMAPQLDKLHLRGDGYIARFFINNADDMYHITDQCFSINDQEDVNEVKQLTFLSKLKLSVRVLTDYSWLSCLSLLTELEIECENYHNVGSLKLNDITNHCPPTLKRLKLVKTKYPFLMLGLASVNVESLILEGCHLPRGIDIFISQVFLRLDSLVISGGDIERKYFSLLNANLSHFQLELPFPSDTDDVHVVTRANTQQRRYRPTHAHSSDNACEDLDVYPAIKSQPAHQVRTLPYFTLICNSLKNIRVLKTSWS